MKDMRTVLLLLMFLSSWSLRASVSDIQNEDESTRQLEYLTQNANYIFKGTVIKTENRLSEKSVNAPNGVPYTFVTYRIDSEFKGKSVGDEITLRFVGGAINDEQFMIPSGMPLMDVGDQDVLFIQNNGVQDCPIVNCSDGRFREIDGLVFNELGQSILIDAEGHIKNGQQINLEEVVSHSVSDTIQIRRIESEIMDDDYGVQTLQELQDNNYSRLDPATFETQVQETVNRIHSDYELSNLTEEQSADASQPFFDNVFTPGTIGKLQSFETEEEQSVEMNIAQREVHTATEEALTQKTPLTDTASIVKNEKMPSKAKDKSFSVNTITDLDSSLSSWVLIVSLLFVLGVFFFKFKSRKI